MSSVATPALEVKAVAVNPSEVSRKNAVARLRRIAKRHNLRIITYHRSDGRHCYGLEAKIPILGPRAAWPLSLDDLVSLCTDLAYSRNIAAKEDR